MTKAALYSEGDRYINDYAVYWQKNHSAKDYGSNEEYYNALKKYVGSNKDKAMMECAQDFINAYTNHQLSDKALLSYSAAGLYFDSDYRKLVEDHFEKQGYNAVTDITGIGFSSRKGYDPLIVLNTESTLEKVSTHKVSDIKSDKSMLEYEKWADKNRKYGLNNALDAD